MSVVKRENMMKEYQATVQEFQELKKGTRSVIFTTDWDSYVVDSTIRIYEFDGVVSGECMYKQVAIVEPLSEHIFANHLINLPEQNKQVKYKQLVNKIPPILNGNPGAWQTRLLKYIEELESVIVDVIHGDEPDYEYIDHLFDD